MGWGLKGQAKNPLGCGVGKEALGRGDERCDQGRRTMGNWWWRWGELGVKLVVQEL